MSDRPTETREFKALIDRLWEEIPSQYARPVEYALKQLMRERDEAVGMSEKHDGYAVFMPDGTIILRSVRGTESASEAEWGSPAFWVNYRQQGYTVRPVTIEEVKDDD